MNNELPNPSGEAASARRFVGEDPRQGEGAGAPLREDVALDSPVPSDSAVNGRGRERPILFSGEMVRALLAGRKTQTRRVVNPQPSAGVRVSPFVPSGLEDGHGRPLKPRWFVGDRLWVRETWTSGYSRGCWGTIFAADGKFCLGARQHAKGPHFNADDRPPLKFKPSIFMPPWASRISLAVTEVRIQRVQEISEADARAEGVEPVMMQESWSVLLKDGGGYNCFVEPEPDPEIAAFVHVPSHELLDAKSKFATLWDSINSKRPGCAWGDNPWVFAVSFEIARDA